MPDAFAPQIIFASVDHPITTDLAIIHSDETFAVKWAASNIGQQDSPAFQDELVVSNIPEGCPGANDQEHPVVFDSNFDEASIPAGKLGPQIQATVGPFPTGAYRLSVTLAKGLVDTTATNCIDIVDPV
jgi:hypothetical protein